MDKEEKKPKKEILVKEREKHKKKGPKAEEIGTSIRVLQILKLRESGYNYEQIATELGYKDATSCKHALKGMMANLQKHSYETWEKVRSMEYGELCFLEFKLYELFEACGNDIKLVLQVTDRILKLKDAKAKLLGLNAPEVIEHQHTLPQITLSLPGDIRLNPNKLKERIIEVKDSSDELLGLPEPAETDRDDDV